MASLPRVLTGIQQATESTPWLLKCNTKGECSQQLFGRLTGLEMGQRLRRRDGSMDSVLAKGRESQGTTYSKEQRNAEIQSTY
jgi:hypothetical protein